MPSDASAAAWLAELETPASSSKAMKTRKAAARTTARKS
jgi:hypothetical protein